MVINFCHDNDEETTRDYDNNGDNDGGGMCAKGKSDNGDNLLIGSL